MAHPAESTHWYDKDGKPCYTVVGANGKERPTTLRDARKMGLYPSVTSIIRLASTPGLERWKQEQILHAALTLPRLPEWSEAQWIEAIYTDSQEQGKKAADLGTAIHAAIESRVGGEYPNHVQSAFTAVQKWLGPSVWTSEQSFIHPLGFGGKCDDNCTLGVVDYKTTEKPLETIKTWPEHAWQLSAYREGLGMPTARCAIVYVHVASAEAKVIELEEDELKKGWECFKALLLFHQAKTGYRATMNSLADTNDKAI